MISVYKKIFVFINLVMLIYYITKLKMKNETNEKETKNEITEREIINRSFEIVKILVLAKYISTDGLARRVARDNETIIDAKRVVEKCLVYLKQNEAQLRIGNLGFILKDNQIDAVRFEK